MVLMERRNLQSSVINVTTAKRLLGLSADTYNGEMHDTILDANGTARTKDRYFLCRLAHEMATTWKKT